MQASLSTTYCNQYFTQQENAKVCGQNGIQYWCKHKVQCGVVSFIFIFEIVTGLLNETGIFVVIYIFIVKFFALII